MKSILNKWKKKNHNRSRRVHFHNLVRYKTYVVDSVINDDDDDDDDDVAAAAAAANYDDTTTSSNRKKIIYYPLPPIKSIDPK